MTQIRGFKDDYAWASNFCQAPVTYDGFKWPDNEHPFHWKKTPDRGFQALIMQAGTAWDAKRLGRQAPLRPDWEQIKKLVMFDLALAKFQQNPRLRQLLVATGDAEMIEDNTWGDTYWGVCRGRGHNYLGRILMSVRDLLRED
jgi:ribA/ribD-fused uncharacterized protein